MSGNRSCAKCGSSGRYVYGSTATWYGGFAGQMVTEDVCDRCWGTGDELNPGENLRARVAIERAKKSQA